MNTLREYAITINIAVPPILLVSCPQMGMAGLVLCALATTASLLWMIAEDLQRAVRK